MGMKTKRILTYLFLILITCLWISPIYFSVLASLKGKTEFITTQFWSFPSKIELWNNVTEAWSRANIGNSFLNSLLYATAAPTCALILASLVAFPCAKLKFKGRNFVFYLFLLGTFLPFQMFLIPQMLLLIKMGIYSTHIGLLLVYIALTMPFLILVLRNYMVTIPSEVIEAARLDGFSNFSIFWRIILPLSKPAIAVGMVFQSTWIWNDYIFGLVLSRSPSVAPIMTVLAGFSGPYGTNWPVMLTGALITMIPPIIIFLCLQKYFVKGFTLRV
jgi:multiple sugar transport system permease protein